MTSKQATQARQASNTSMTSKEANTSVTGKQASTSHRNHDKQANKTQV
jgi:hypothetical protein